MASKDPDAKKRYHREYFAEWYERNYKKVRERVDRRRREISEFIKSKKIACIKCGETHSACLEFHHNDPSKKTMVIAVAVNKGFSIARIMHELQNCTVLCANCHRKLHWS